MAESKLTGGDIEDILDEIQEKEEKQHNTNTNISNDSVTWKDILHHLRERKTHFIKNLITSKEIHVNAKNPSDGKTLLIYAVIIGNLGLVEAICNFGADIKIKDNDKLDAFDYAMIYGRYKITEMVYYRQLSGKLGNDLKQISIQMHQKNKEAQYIYESCDKRSGKEAYIKRTKCSECGMRAGILCAICKKNSGVEKAKLYDNIIHFMIGAIRERASFDPSMLYYAWYFVLKKCEISGSDPFQHELWETMMNVYDNILKDTRDKIGWKWLKEEFINSLIWYLPHPQNKVEAASNRNKRRKKIEDKEKMENTLYMTLFYELLHRVRKEAKNQSVLLLKEKIDTIKSKKANEWKQLIAYNVSIKQSKRDIKRAKGARQDSYGCLKPKYNKYDLSETKYPSSTHFSANKHYDTKIYLNELIFRGNILDNLFQNDMKNITKQINKEIGDKVTYRAGPVKTLTRSQTKVNNDYIKEQYPTSAKILDINRCALQFKTITQMMKYLKILSDKIKNEEAGCIQKIVRCKNGWTVYNSQNPQYTDIKLNVLIKSEYDGSIIAEIQFLLDMMSSFKKKAHKLYSIERKSEFVYNYGLLTEKISEFKDLSTITAVLNDLAINDDHKRFKYLWQNNIPNIELLVNMDDNPRANILDNLVLNILIHRKGDIHRYLTNNFQDIYRSALMAYFFNFKIKSFDSMLSKLVHHGANQKKVTQRIIDLFNTNKDKKLDKKSDPKKILQSLNMFLHPLYDNLSPFLIEHKAFNYYQLQAPSINIEHDYFSIMDETEFKFEDDSSQSGSLFYWKSSKRKRKKLQLKHAVLDFKISKMASYDAGHSLILDTNGNVYAIGDADPRKESVPLESTENIINKPVLMPSSLFNSHKVVHIAVGGAHSLVLTEDGNVWSWGFGKNGRLGHNSTENLSSPKLINSLLDVDIISIACGALHNCAISINGDLFCWGNNVWGQCALKTKTHKEVRVPTKIKFNVKEETDRLLAVYAACSNTYTLLLTTNGTLLSFGGSVYGCLGHGEDNKLVEHPRIIQDLASECVVDVAAGERRCLCVTKKGALYQWGEAFHTIKYNDWSPKRVLKDFFEHKQIVSCRVNTEQSSLITAEGELYELKPEKVHHPQFMGCDIAIHPRKINDAFKQLQGKFIVDAFLDKEYNFVVACDRNEDEKMEDESDANGICLGVNQHVVIRNEIGQNLKGKSFKMYVENKSIYGDLKWNLLASNKQYLPFPNYTDIFVNNLQLVDKQKIVLRNYEDIDEIYHSEILQSKYALILNQNALEMKQESISKDEICKFSSMDDIQFDIKAADAANNELNVSIYVLPQTNCDTFVLLKQFK